MIDDSQGVVVAAVSSVAVVNVARVSQPPWTWSFNRAITMRISVSFPCHLELNFPFLSANPGLPQFEAIRTSSLLVLYAVEINTPRGGERTWIFQTLWRYTIYKVCGQEIPSNRVAVLLICIRLNNEATLGIDCAETIIDQDVLASERV